jgi:hypothetical protein
VTLKRRAKQAKHFTTRERAALWMTDEHHVRRVIHGLTSRDGVAGL